MSLRDADEEDMSLKRSSRSPTFDRDSSTMALMKYEYPSDDEAPQEKLSQHEYKSSLEDEKQTEEYQEDAAPSSFRLRLAEAQLTDSLSVADHDNVDVMADKV